VGLIFQILFYILQVFNLILLARVLLSWFPNVDRSNPLIQLVYDITEPVLRPIRDLLPPSGMIDFSPLVVFLIIQVLLTILRTMV
jgi:YggT family protein